jgi:hypothetical protein
LTSANSISYALIFTESVTDLTTTDFVTTGSSANCTAIGVTGTAASYTITASGCGSGILKLTLLANSISGGASGPPTAITAGDVTFDHAAPTVSVTSPGSPNNDSALNYTIVFSESVSGLSATDFAVQPSTCVIGAPSGSTTNYTLQISNCADASSVQLSLLQNSVVDSAGNAGPTSSPTIATVLIDKTASEPSWSPVAASTTADPSFEVAFVENVQGLTASDFSISGTATGCVVSLTEVIASAKFNLLTSGCSFGTVKATLAAGAYTDSLGNSGPTAPVASGETTFQAVVVAAPPAPVSAPAPANNPAPSSNSSPVENLPAKSEAAPEPAPMPAPEPEVIIASPNTTRSYVLNGDAYQSLSDPEPVSSQPDLWDSQIVVNNPTDPVLIKANFDFSTIASIALTGLAAILASIGFAKWAAQIRSRRLVRKFS